MIAALLRALGWVHVNEVVQQDSFETELSAITPDPVVREEVRQVALTAAKVGMVSADEFARLIQLGMSLTIVRARDLEWAKGKTPLEIDERIASITADVDDFEPHAGDVFSDLRVGCVTNRAKGGRDA